MFMSFIEKEKNKSNKFVYIIIAFLSIRLLINLLTLIPADVFVWYSSFEFIFVSMITTYIIYDTSKLYEAGNKNRTYLRLIAIGTLGWALGETIWVFYELVLLEAPYPSIADFFYIIAYIPIAFALFSKARDTKIEPDKGRLIVVIIVVFDFILIALFVLIIPIFQYGDEPLVTIISIMYPILDIILVINAGYIVAKFAGGRMEKAWLIYGLAMFTNAIADTLFGYEDWNEIYNSHSLADFLFLVSYLLTIYFCKYLKETFDNNL